jgi:hypothetical protein
MHMQLPKVHGVIGRRLLVNFRAEPGVVQRHLPSPFRPSEASRRPRRRRYLLDSAGEHPSDALPADARAVQ